MLSSIQCNFFRHGCALSLSQQIHPSSVEGDSGGNLENCLHNRQFLKSGNRFDCASLFQESLGEPSVVRPPKRTARKRSELHGAKHAFCKLCAGLCCCLSRFLQNARHCRRLLLSKGRKFLVQWKDVAKLTLCSDWETVKAKDCQWGLGSLWVLMQQVHQTKNKHHDLNYKALVAILITLKTIVFK